VSFLKHRDLVLVPGASGSPSFDPQFTPHAVILCHQPNPICVRHLQLYDRRLGMHGKSFPDPLTESKDFGIFSEFAGFISPPFSMLYPN